jgi:murein DD-endopeptidase MepM/ murein hydrolase activator NlpD
LKYTESFSNKRRFGAGFYIVVACCLILIGGASWFALSNLENQDRTPVPKTNSGSSEYMDNISSYTESKTEEPIISSPTESTAQEVESEPYSSNAEVIAEEEKTVQNNFTMPVEGEILKDFSDSILQYSATFGDMRFHKGIDIACKYGTQIFSCADGKVTDIENSTDYGTTVTIKHSNGIIVKYSAIKDVTVKTDSEVKMGDVLGISASIPCECNDNSHIHIEAYKDGKQVSPLKAFGLE